MNKRATPQLFMLYKHSLLLHRIFNSQAPNADGILFPLQRLMSLCEVTINFLFDKKMYHSKQCRLNRFKTGADQIRHWLTKNNMTLFGKGGVSYFYAEIVCALIEVTVLIASLASLGLQAGQNNLIKKILPLTLPNECPIIPLFPLFWNGSHAISVAAVCYLLSVGSITCRIDCLRDGTV